MEFTIIDPKLPSIGRWLRLGRRYQGQSTLRKLEYEALAAVKISGKVLDIGGGEAARYKQHLPEGIEYKSANIDPDIKPTFLVKPGEKIPAPSNSFDHCLSMNTLEHVYDPVFLLSEMRRLLKPGGTAYISVPWIFRIHAHPDDYGRYTPSWWQISLEKAGFKSAQILPLIWGRYSTASTITGFRGPLKSLQNFHVHMKDIIYASIAMRSKNGTYEGKRGQRICNVALGYFITAVR